MRRFDLSWYGRCLIILKPSRDQSNLGCRIQSQRPVAPTLHGFQSDPTPDSRRKKFELVFAACAEPHDLVDSSHPPGDMLHLSRAMVVDGRDEAVGPARDASFRRSRSRARPAMLRRVRNRPSPQADASGHRWPRYGINSITVHEFGSEAARLKRPFFIAESPFVTSFPLRRSILSV